MSRKDELVENWGYEAHTHTPNTKRVKNERGEPRMLNSVGTHARDRAELKTDPGGIYVLMPKNRRESHFMPDYTLTVSVRNI